MTARKYKISYSLLKEWVARTREQGVESLNSKCTRYDVRFKMDVLNYMNNTGASPYKQPPCSIFHQLVRLENGKGC